MAGLEGLASIIYHEKQQPGSMLCAQHALNSLLQGSFFTAPDLSEIAGKLDRLEEQYNTESRQNGSKNMDDTGFFSVQVIEEALKVWGLNLVRWRSSAMQPYQDHPHTQLAFILNLGQHWFTLRRFGPASANVDKDPGKGHWFNLNSSLPAPEWVGKLYLGMVLQQAESEGYSVFAVTQADPSLPLSLSRTEADDVAATLPEPQSASQSSIYYAAKRASDNSGSTRQPFTREGRLDASKDIEDLGEVEDEDFELQAALQASLSSQEGYGTHFYEDGHASSPIQAPPLATANPSRPDSNTVASGSTSTENRDQSSQELVNTSGHADLDPVAASMERNRVLLRRMREQQELAQRELWSSNGLTPEQRVGQEVRRQERLRQEEEEAEQLRKAIAESEALAREYHERQKAGSGPSEVPPSDMDAVTPADAFGYSTLEHSNYDDEDAELQAALRASLENIPEGWEYPETSQSPPSKLPEHQVQASKSAKNVNILQDMDVDGDEEWPSESEVDHDGTASSKGTSAVAREQAAPNVDEIRLARLARFGS